ncbi:FAD-dependent oxidoreductase [Pyrococcus sp. ST04]|uniref:FAD-dependent oxidoreductase n=1 Tax=Pyrococcus sp. ST04 TaxID=1183377 RepID=UPI0002605F57|nr:FAD-dependent oxidoreductase [Pyrococcus sp. ST04]AFK23303.1 putative glutamate synthase subunit beta [Pyrococcus sp. ST04]
MKFCTCGERDKTKPFKIAIIGAGPAGLSAACNLACRGFEVHVYDKMPEPGGMVAFGIPEWRIPIRSVREGVKEIEELGVIFHMRTKVVYDSPKELGDEWAERFVSLEKLMNEFDAILIATGAWRPKILKIPGYDLEGVRDALSTLFRIKLVRIGYLPKSEMPSFEGQRVIIVGAGYTAVDMTKEAMMLGAREVVIAYRRSLEHSYAKAEIKKLIKEGAKLVEYVTPEKIIGDERVREVEFARTKIVNGSVVKTEERVTLPADSLIFAIGQIPTNPIREITCANEEILRDSGIFFAGDVISPRNIGTAILEGRRVARAIEEWLMTHAPRRLLPPTLAGRLIAEVIEGKC